MDYMATEPEDIGQDVFILTETDQELQLNQHAEQVELKAQRVLESFPFFSSPSTEENLVQTHPTVISDTTESSLNTTTTLDLLKASDETLSPTEMNYDSGHPIALINNTINTTETYDSPQNTSLLPSGYNETDSHHNLNFTFHQFEPENHTGFPEPSYEPHTHNQTFLDTNPEDNTLPSVQNNSQGKEGANLGFDRSQANYSENESNHTQEESFWEETYMTIDPMVQVKLEEATVEDPVEMSPSTQASKEEEELVIQSAQTTKSTIRELNAFLAHLDGSGDISQGMSSIHLNLKSISTS